MSEANSSNNQAAVSRLKKDYMKLKKDPLPFISAEPLHTNILDWHYVIQGPPETPYFGGYYHGKLKFPPEFPFRPPSIYMTTPNGRFKPNFRLCLSMSDYHPDTWNPSWTVSTILTGLLSFMLEDTVTLGSLDTTDEEKRIFAQRSLDFNANDPVFAELFPDIFEEIKQTISIRDESRTTASVASGEPNDEHRARSLLMGSRFRRYIDFLRRKVNRNEKK